MATRKSARTISTDISTIASRDLIDSDAETDMDPERTLIGNEQEEDTETSSSSSSSLSSSEDEEEADSDSMDGEPVDVPKKRKRAQEKEIVVSAKKQKPKAQIPPPRKIEYKISIYTAKQMMKAKSARGDPVTEVLILKSDITWQNLKTHVLTTINNALNPELLNFFDYHIVFTIPRKVSEPIRLIEDKYDYLVTKALEIKKSPEVKIKVEPIPVNRKENGDESDASASGKKAVKKSKIPKARDILPANIALDEKIGALREKWKCPTPGAPCGSEHCFVNATDPEHFPLSHAHMQSWGAAMLKGSAFADLDTPPNNQLFDTVASAARASRSPLLQRRLEKQQTANNNGPPPAQVHFNIPPEFANLFRPPPLAPAVAAPLALNQPPSTEQMLIPSSRVPGDDLAISAFCEMYDLDTDIADRFTQNRYKRTMAFKFIEVSELKEMGFMNGEIAELKVAVDKWSHVV
ncbi:hypothetical protein K438DRAFT_2026635 [Mycena galopus ATCC 62051]|nr:hypothetical protein K438DRAFT_2026635 [Mycena galopus ATCC 62051]